MSSELDFIVGAVTRIETKLDGNIQTTAEQGERITKVEADMSNHTVQVGIGLSRTRWITGTILTIMGLLIAAIALI